MPPIKGESQMNMTAKLVAWACIFSILITGCYNSVMVEPTGEGKEKIYSDRVSCVITKDGTEYEFEKAPTIVNDTIVGEVKIPMEPGFTRKEVSIPLSNVAEVYVKEPNPVATIFLVPGIIAGVYLLLVVLTAVDIAASTK